MRSMLAWLRGLLAPEEASLAEIRKRPERPVGRTVPAELAKRPASEMVRCGCGVLFRPRTDATTCLACERGDDPQLGKLIAPRPTAEPQEAEEPNVAEFRRRQK